MWLSFWLGFLLFGIFTVLPGFLVGKAIGFKSIDSICYSTCISVPIYEIQAIVFGQLGVFSKWDIYVMPLLVIGLIAFLARVSVARKGRLLPLKAIATPAHERKNERSWMLLLYIASGLFFSIVVIVFNLSAADSYNQTYDNYFHLTTPLIYSQNGNWSTFHAGLYTGAEGLAFPEVPEHTWGYYPAEWHMLVALLQSAIAGPITLSVNIVDVFIISTIFPMGMYILMKEVFRNDFKYMVLGTVCPFAFAVFPYLAFVSGLIPNYCSICFIPFALASFIKGLRTWIESGRFSVREFTLFLLCVACIGFMHPSSVFAIVVAMAVISICQVSACDRFSLKKRLIIDFSIVACLCVFWAAMFNTELVQRMAFYTAQPVDSPQQAIIDIATFSFVEGWSQIVVGLFVFLGLVYTFTHRKYLWISICFLIFAFIFSLVVCTDSDFWLKRLLSAFWYGAIHRSSWNMMVFAVLLLVLGLNASIQAVSKLFGKTHLSKKAATELTVAAILFFAIVPLFPQFQLRGLGEVPTAFGSTEKAISNHFILHMDAEAPSSTYTQEEDQFVKRVIEMIGPDAVIANVPADGSFLAFATKDANIYFRGFVGAYTDNARLILNKLNEYATNKEVKKAVEEAGIKYVMLLDAARYDDEDMVKRYSYVWKGVSSITPKTKGFKLLYKKGDMLLYELTDV